MQHITKPTIYHFNDFPPLLSSHLPDTTLQTRKVLSWEPETKYLHHKYISVKIVKIFDKLIQYYTSISILILEQNKSYINSTYLLPQRQRPKPRPRGRCPSTRSSTHFPLCRYSTAGWSHRPIRMRLTGRQN